MSAHASGSDQPPVRVHDLDEYRRVVAARPLVLAYVGGDNCGVCAAIKPKVADILRRYPAVYALEIDAHTDRELAAQLSVFSIPALLVSAGGREAIREARYFSIAEFEAKLQRLVQLMS